MIITVASGKGGTGKTTVAVSMAFSLGSQAQILDCDVEEPNGHLFLKPKMETTEKVWATVPEIDEDKCIFCQKCSDICRFKAIAMLGETCLVFPELCHSCGGCFEVCPENAINKGQRELGTLELGRSGEIDFVHGRLRVGEAMAPPLINKVRSYVNKNKIAIIDAPPGTSCPVIAAMKEADFVLMVSEPTPFGLHDLKLGVEAIRTLNIPFGLVINRSGIGNDDIWDYAKDEQIPVLMEIPFDRKIAEVYSRGGIVPEQMPEWKEPFIELYKKIQETVQK